jgi:Protein of unknown function (DUF3634)
MDTWLPALLLVGLSLPIWWGLSRATEVFFLRVHDGRIRRARGRLPRALLGEIEDVLARTQCSGWVRAKRSRGAVVVDVRGDFGAGTTQQLRNVIGTVPLQRMISAAPVQRFGGSKKR